MEGGEGGLCIACIGCRGEGACDHVGKLDGEYAGGGSEQKRGHGTRDDLRGEGPSLAGEGACAAARVAAHVCNDRSGRGAGKNVGGRGLQAAYLALERERCRFSEQQVEDTLGARQM